MSDGIEKKIHVKKKRKGKNDYVNNAAFFAAIVERQKLCREAEDQDEEKPVVTKYIGECIYEISWRLSTKPNFYNYPFREDMVMDGVENCLLYMHNFDPEKTQNPFAYFTQIIYFAFLRRIHKEKKQMYIRYKSSQHLLSTGGTALSGDTKLNLSTDVDYINSFISDFEEKIEKDKQKKKDNLEEEEADKNDTSND
jgi:hypothetical protein